MEVPRQVILGACNPPLAHAALQAEPSIGLLLPCNVVVRSRSDDVTIVEAVDPQTMVAMTDNAALQVVADDATVDYGGPREPHRPTHEGAVMVQSRPDRCDRSRTGSNEPRGSSMR